MQPDDLASDPITRLGPLPLVTISPDQSVLDAALAMKAAKQGCAVVCDEGKPVGVITERDLLRRMGTSLPLDVPAWSAINGEVWSLCETDSLFAVIELMNRRRCRHLVVVSPQGKAVGVVSVREVMRYLVEHFPKNVYNLPPVPDAVPEAREGA